MVCRGTLVAGRSEALVSPYSEVMLPSKVLLLVVPLGGLAGILLWAEVVHWRSTTRRMGLSPRLGGREATVVLGYQNRGTRANYINRYRVRAAIRSQDPSSRESILGLCGGCVSGEIAEAELMARCMPRKAARPCGSCVRSWHSHSRRHESIDSARSSSSNLSPRSSA